MKSEPVNILFTLDAIFFTRHPPYLRWIWWLHFNWQLFLSNQLLPHALRAHHHQHHHVINYWHCAKHNFNVSVSSLSPRNFYATALVPDALSNHLIHEVHPSLSIQLNFISLWLCSRNQHHCKIKLWTNSCYTYTVEYHPRQRCHISIQFDSLFFYIFFYSQSNY